MERFENRLDKLKSFDRTEEKQAINMAMLLVADELACECIFEKEEKLAETEVVQYMFDKKTIDNTERAYQYFIDSVIESKNKFCDIDNDNGFDYTPREFYGYIAKNTHADYSEIWIIPKSFKDILKRENFNINKVLKEWEKKGYIEHDSTKSTYTKQKMVAGVRGSYYVIRVFNKDKTNTSNVINFFKGTGIAVNEIDE